MSITSSDLHVFSAVVEEGSFGRAATSLLISQPSVSQRIARLEARLDVDLFVRTPQGVTLTPSGEALAPFARRQVGLLDNAVRAVRATAQVPSMVVAVHSTFTSRIAPSVIDALSTVPRRVEFRDAHTDGVIEMVADGEADLGFIVPATTPRTLVAQRIADDPITCVVSPSHRLAHRPRSWLRDLADGPVAFNDWGTGALVFADLLAQSHGRPERVVRVPDARTAAVLACEHGHAAVLALSAAAPEVAVGLLVEVQLADLPEWRVEVEIVHRATTIDPAVAVVVERLASSR